jgi:hypothetical protein
MGSSRNPDLWPMLGYGGTDMSAAVMPYTKLEMSPRLQARIAGGFYLINIVTGIFAIMLVRSALLVPGDAAATANNILAHEMRFRLGFVAEIVTCLTNIPLAVIFYNLFRVVNRNLALADMFLGLVGTAIEAVVLVNHFAPLLFLQSGSRLSAFTPAQLQAQAYVSLQMMDIGLSIALVFFGFDCVLNGYLILRSTFLPRIIGVLLAIEGLGYLINSFSLFIAPAVQARIFPYFMATGIGEISLCLWLLVRGVNVERWREWAAGFGI